MDQCTGSESGIMEITRSPIQTISEFKKKKGSRFDSPSFQEDKMIWIFNI